MRYLMYIHTYIHTTKAKQESNYPSDKLTKRNLY